MKVKASKVLLTAYAVNPFKGSEDGTGWNIIFEIAKHQKVLAITRENNQAAIEQYLAAQGLDTPGNLNFAYFDLPYWMRWWKKGERGALLYFYLWQIGVVFFIWRKQFKFEIAHHLNFHSDWMPSFLWVFGKPFVWGPIGHHPEIPKAYVVDVGGHQSYYLDQLKSLAKRWFWKYDPFLKLTKWRADKILTINSSVLKVLNFAADKEIRLPAVANRKEKRPSPKTKSKHFMILSIGRFVSLKGFDLVIRSFAQFYHEQSFGDQASLQLCLIGKGPLKDRLQALAVQLKVSEAVIFKSWMPRAALDQYFEQASLFFFASHEGAGMVVPEALSFGLPVLCFDNIGPGEMIDETCAWKIPYTNPAKSVQQFSQKLNFIFANQMHQASFSRQARAHYEQYFTWERKGILLHKTYNELLANKSYESIPEADAAFSLPFTKYVK